MTSEVTITLPDGRTWTPRFVKNIDQEKCIGCGRCFRVCGREVLQLVGIDEDGGVMALALDEDDDDEYEKKVMTVANQINCIGCEACAKICPKKCYTHEAMTT
ncbi:MAG TPA: ferredoxin III, nif-specific [Gallionellaceae bacterium]|nr:ferredoxin III, nif-specific [Gallionellaceae bacterium]